MSSKKILIVEDDIDISNMLRDLLTINKYEVFCAYSGTEALLLIERTIYDLVLLDLMLPGMSGQQVITHISRYIPVIGISAISDIDEKINLLKNGAVDYITKPFDNGELLARIEVQLRNKNSNEINTPANILEYQGIILDLDSFTSTIDGHPLELTRIEWTILHLLMEHPTKVFSKSNLYKSVWKDEFYGDDNTINVHMSNLRSKLQNLGSKESYIQTVWGIGFKLADDE